ncbi:hypothetical protein [Hymenobacter metallilatus]|uniref:Glycosyltransferase RgtA/B/C/D-like domain-containing protein n=1 Tax=Hymenobacter metallilatus TaxID=2493666 RepID=A0A3R9NMX6_9BACT|nr:hypothetical protein [Hymenobacter metallilatus]RSK32361.1 hypothetical protein EI290_11550 [Hymenobacter metallilatus]
MTDSRPLLSSQTTRIPRWVWAGLVVMHLLALGWQLHARQPLFPDSDRYVQAARNLRDAGTLYALPLTEQPLQAQEYSIRPPGYPVFLLLTGGAGPAIPWAALLLQNALSLLNLALVLQWLMRCTGGLRRKQWAVLLLLAAAGTGQFIYANVLMSEILLQTLVVVLWRCLDRFWNTGYPAGALAGAAGATTVALLVKPVFYPFAGVLLLLGIVVGWRQHRPWLVLATAVPLLVALLWMGRNEARTGYFHFSSIAEINLLRYNARGVLQAAAGPQQAEKFVRASLTAASRQPGFAAQQEYIRRQSMRALLAHPVTCLGQQARGMLTFFLDPGRFDLVHFLRLPQTASSGLLQLLNQRSYRAAAQYLGQLPWGVLSALGLLLLANVVRLGLLLRFGGSRTYSWPARLLLLGVILYVAALTGPLGAARFAVPVLPLLLAGAGAGLTVGQPEPAAQLRSRPSAS